jgi:hypothetical protein
MVDRYGPPDQQVRGGTITTHTPSLEEYGNEPVPDEIVRDLLIDQWIESEKVPRPAIVVKSDKMQQDMRRADILSVYVADWRSEFVGYRHENVNVEIPIDIEIKTAVSRQRLWNLMAEVRRIIYKNILAIRPYQSTYFDGFKPDYEGLANFHTGTVSIRLTADMLPWYTMVVDDMASPNVDPDATSP